MVLHLGVLGSNHRNIQGVSKKRGPFLKLVQFLYFPRNLSKILYGHSKIILFCSGEDSMYSGTSAGSDVKLYL